jgi:hypothetical protein
MVDYFLYLPFVVDVIHFLSLPNWTA